MKKQINLKLIADELDMVSGSMNYYLNTKIGKTVLVTEDLESLGRIEESEIPNLPEWQQGLAREIKAIEETDDYIQLPSSYDIHEFNIMTDFCEAIANKRISNDISQSMRGKGAFRKFQDKIFHYDLRDDYYAFKKEALFEIAKEWCETHDIPYIDDRPKQIPTTSKKVAEHLVAEIESQDDLSLAEIKAVLRGADEMIASGGRSLLAKLLNGSKAKNVLKRGLDSSPVYGYFSELSEAKIMNKIDWVIQHGYLKTEIYDGKFPLLVFTPKGWEVEKDTMADELLAGFEGILEKGVPFDMSHLKDRNREMILLLLEKVRQSGDRRYIFLLEAWAAIDYKKVRQRINSVIKSLEKK